MASLYLAGSSPTECDRLQFLYMTLLDSQIDFREFLHGL